VGEATQKFVASIMKDDCFAHRSAKAGHSIGKPLWHAPAMQRKIGASSSSRHWSSFESFQVRLEINLPPNGVVGNNGVGA
jgi:hypothetical protein